MKRKDLFTAPQVAKLCSTDLKTIHNWVNRGKIKFFRTPGRHLRFRAEDVVEFLVDFGYPVPEELRGSRKKAILIASNDARSDKISANLRESMDVLQFDDFVSGLIAVGQHSPTVVVMNGEAIPEVTLAADKLSKLYPQMQIIVHGDFVSPSAVEQDANDVRVSIVPDAAPEGVVEGVLSAVKKDFRRVS